MIEIHKGTGKSGDDGALVAAPALFIVPGATHLFEEPGTLDTAAALAGDWFLRWLARDAGFSPRTAD